MKGCNTCKYKKTEGDKQPCFNCEIIGGEIMKWVPDDFIMSLIYDYQKKAAYNAWIAARIRYSSITIIGSDKAAELAFEKWYNTEYEQPTI